MAQKMIHVDGLRDFQRNLKTLDNDLAKALRKALNAGADIVVEGARPLVPTLSGRAKKSVKAASTQKEARVRGGGKRVPYFPWLEFGGKVGRDGSISRGRVSKGRYLYPTLARNSDEVEQVLTDELFDVARGAGIEVEDGV